MKNLGGYIFNLKSGEIKVELKDWKPVFHIKENADENVVCQLGLNISHQKSKAYFNQLIDKDYVFNLKLAKKVLKSAYFIGLNHDFVSKFVFDRRNSIKIATNNESLIELLEIEDRKYKEFSLENKIRKNEFFENNRNKKGKNIFSDCDFKTDFIKLISKEPFLYKMFLSMNYNSFSDNKEELNYLHDKVLEKIDKIFVGREDVKKLNNLFKESLKSGFLSKLQNDMSEYNINPFLEAKKEYQKQIPENVRAMIGIKSVNKIYDDFIKNPFEWKKEDLKFEDLFKVKKMPTNLNRRASKDYEKDILSFELIEPYKKYEKRKNILNSF